MIGMVLTGHAHFADGLASAMALILGDTQGLEVVPFLEGDSDEALGKILEEAAKAYDGNVVFFTDIAGGSPCKQAALVTARHGGVVVTGTNLPLLLKAALDREGTPEEAVARWIDDDVHPARVTIQKREHKAKKGGI